MKFLYLTNKVSYVCGNFIAGSPIKLQHRVFQIHSAKGNNGLSFGQGRYYSSSSPVKYVPKKSRTQENESAYIELPFLKSQNQRHDAAYNVDNEGHNQLKMDVSTAHPIDSHIYLNTETRSPVSLNGIHRNIEVDGEYIRVDENGSTTGSGRLEVEKAAIRLLGARAFTELELKKKLLQKKFLPGIIDAVVKDFRSMGLLNDGLYAESLSRSRWRSSTWGPRKIKQALVKKGVSQVHVQKAIKMVFADEADEEQDPKLGGMSKSSFDELYDRASKQWLRSRDAPRETRQTRIVSWLQYRGFNYGVIRIILQKLESNPTEH